jgi:LysM repeat protein
MPKPMYVWSGSAWVSVATEVESLAGYATQSYADNQPGMKLIVPSSVTVGSGTGSVATQGTVTFSGASSVSLNGVFTSTYDNYRIIMQLTPTASDAFRVRLRNAGTDETAAQYNNAFFNVRVNNTSGVSAANASATSATFESIVANFKNSLSMDIFGPKLTEYTSASALLHMGISASDAKMYFGGFQLSNSTSYDSITWLMSSGTMTGNVRIYGYKAG